MKVGKIGNLKKLRTGSNNNSNVIGRLQDSVKKNRKEEQPNNQFISQQ